MSQSWPYHAFAHHAGRYQTVSAIGVTERESRTLEQYFFGQSNDPAYLDSLKSEPGVIWRTVEGRVALTRVRPGRNDQHGRATLAFETILLPVDAAVSAAGKLGAIVRARWTEGPEGVTIASPSGAEDQLHPEKISDVMMAIQRGQRVVRRSEGFSLADVGKIVSGFARDAGFSLCFKSLNRSASVSVNLVAQEVTEGNLTASAPKKTTQSVPRKGNNMPPRNGSSGSLFIAIAIYVGLALQLLIVWQATRDGAVDQGSRVMQDNIINSVHEAQSWKESDVKSTIAQIDGLCESTEKAVNKLISIETAIESVSSAMSTKLEELGTMVSSLRRQLKNLETTTGLVSEELDKNTKAIGRLKNEMEAVGTRLGEVESSVEGFSDAIDQLKNRLRPFSDAQESEPSN